MTRFLDAILLNQEGELDDISNQVIENGNKYLQILNNTNLDWSSLTGNKSKDISSGPNKQNNVVPKTTTPKTEFTKADKEFIMRTFTNIYKTYNTRDLSETPPLDMPSIRECFRIIREVHPGKFNKVDMVSTIATGVVFTLRKDFPERMYSCGNVDYVVAAADDIDKFVENLRYQWLY